MGCDLDEIRANQRASRADITKSRSALHAVGNRAHGGGPGTRRRPRLARTSRAFEPPENSSPWVASGMRFCGVPETIP